jgi:rfaE bifunctional protein kinase chain/domain/rfaE bifunctional protein nucleotidyltransferase chain/domain
MNNSVESSFHQKIVPLAEVATRVAALRNGGLTVAHCHGVFDLLHPGHIDHLEEARQLADILVVSVTVDNYVNKGPGRPLYGIQHRLKMLASLGIVDLVFESNSPTALLAIDHVKPDFFVKGPDYQALDDDITGNITLERNQVEKNGGSLTFTQAPSMSSSQIINSQGLAHSPEAESWLHDFREAFGAEEVSGWVNLISGLNIVVVGEMIVDDYIFCDPLGKTSKEPVLAFLTNSSERQVGGALAIANHCRGLGATVTLVTRFGNDEAGNFAEGAGKASGLSLKVQRSNHHKTIVKTRFVDQHTGAKVFESYEMTDEPITSGEDAEFSELLHDTAKDADVVLVADYGHGLMTERAIASLISLPGIVAVNTQSNAGNRGFNSISRYPRVDVVSLNGGEISLELRAKHARVSDLLPDLGGRTGARWIVVTEGAKGMALWSQSDGVVEMPAFTERVRDRVGAGDALFAAVALFLAVNAPHQVVGLFGNLAGAAMVSDLGNRHTVKAVDLLRHAQALMK